MALKKSTFNEDFFKNYSENSDEVHFYEVDVKYPQQLHKPHNYLLFSPKRMKFEKVDTSSQEIISFKSLCIVSMMKKNTLYTIEF